jgi:hypothetical protein
LDLIWTIAGLVLLAVGAVLTIALAKAWRANLPEFLVFSLLALFVGYVLLPDEMAGGIIAVATSLVFAVATGRAAARLWYDRISFKEALPGIAVLLVTLAGQWLVWGT